MTMSALMLLLALQAAEPLTLEQRADRAKMHMYSMSGELAMIDEIRTQSPHYESIRNRQMDYRSNMAPRYEAARKRSAKSQFRYGNRRGVVAFNIWATMPQPLNLNGPRFYSRGCSPGCSRGRSSLSSAMYSLADAVDSLE